MFASKVECRTFPMISTLSNSHQSSLFLFFISFLLGELIKLTFSWDSLEIYSRNIPLFLQCILNSLLSSGVESKLQIGGHCALDSGKKRNLRGQNWFTNPVRMFFFLLFLLQMVLQNVLIAPRVPSVIVFEVFEALCWSSVCAYIRSFC